MASKGVPPFRDEELAGWKQVASYIDRSIPTAKRYAEHHGLPIRKRGGRYFALKSELDQWLSRSRADLVEQDARGAQDSDVSRVQPQDEASAQSFRAKALWVGLGILALAGIALNGFLPRPGPVERVRALGTEIIALDSQGRERWRRSIDGLWSELLPIQPRVLDLDADGENEVLVSVDSQFPERQNGRLLCLESTGETRWEFTYGKQLTIGDRVFNPYFASHRLRWIDTSTGQFLLVVARHSIWFPTQLSLLDPSSGEVLDEYWHPGNIHAIELIDLDDDGAEELVIGGINNPGPGAGFAAIAVLDIPFGPPTGANHYFGPDNAIERAYRLLPRPDVYEPNELVVIHEIHNQENGRLLAVVASFGHKVIHYDLDFELQVLDARPADTTVIEHDRMFHAGQLDHPFDPSETMTWRRSVPFDAAPDGNAPDIREAVITSTSLEGEDTSTRKRKK